jgi:uncharacterized protein
MTTNPPELDPRDADIQAWIDRLVRWLPEQRPLGVFVHQNPLEALEGQPFHAVCEAATRIRGARTTLSLAQYKQMLASGQIRSEDVAEALTRLRASELEIVEPLPRPAPQTLLLSRVRPEMAIEVGEMVDSFLLRILPAFLDLGSAPWPMPGRERGLLATVGWLARTSLGAPEPWLGGLSERLGRDHEQAGDARALVRACLGKRGDPDSGWPHLIHEALFALPGYAGMIHRLEHVAAERPAGVAVTLIDYLAVRLVVEELALVDVARRLFGRHATLAQLGEWLASCEREPTPTRASWSIELAAFQDAFEERYVRSLIGGIAMAQAHARPWLARRGPVEVQLVVCIDDRSESLRRHVEECVDHSETFGAAGFFGVALRHRAPLDVDEALSCPASLTPSQRVTEQLDPSRASALIRKRKLARALDGSLGDDGSRSPIRGLAASFASFVRAPPRLLQMLVPALFVDSTHEFEASALGYQLDDDPQGFSLADQLARVEGTLRNIGLVDGFARWVLIVGHGSMAVNNQFMSGYQCGACGGKRGGINARVFCAFANTPAVREGLAARGIAIPATTRFVPGEHDTALDQIRWFDLDEIASAERTEFERIQAQLEVALTRNAKERARRFADIPLDEPIPTTHARVRARCADYAETRPEYNHATNAACIIGRRALTRDLFLDRRAFLVSYDPTLDDSEHRILEQLLAAPLPVCAGINLEYLFSTLDSHEFGCGTKLPHNVVGLLGVCTGADGDLRPGLWVQTTEIHEPIRLVTLVEAEPEAITAVLDRLPAVRDPVVHGWIHMFALSPSGRGLFRWADDGFVPYTARPQLLFEVESSLAACANTRAHVAPCLVVGAGEARGAS